MFTHVSNIKRSSMNPGVCSICLHSSISSHIMCLVLVFGRIEKVMNRVFYFMEIEDYIIPSSLLYD